MKILHLADIHLGAYVGPQCDDPYKRMENTIKCLDMVVETARQEQPDVILIAGDIFHTARVWSDRALTEVSIAADYLNKLVLVSPVCVLYGTPNHDGKAQFDALRKMADDSQIIFFQQPDIRYIMTRSGFIQVAGLPGFDKGHFRSQFPGLSAEEENRVFSEQMKLIVDGLSAQVDPTIPSILMAHHTVTGCDLDNGQSTLYMQNEMVLEAATLDNSNFDFVCLGHIHKAQRVSTCSKPVYYSGSLDAFNFNDEGHDKGFYIHEIGLRTDLGILKPQSLLIRTPFREFITYSFDQVTIKGINQHGPYFMRSTLEFKNKVVRILYTCDSETEKALDKKKLEHDLYAAGAYYVSEIRPEKVHEVVNKEQMHEKLTVWDCLRRYLQEKFKDNKLVDYALVIDEASPIVSKVEASEVTGGQTGLFMPLEIDVKNYRSYAEEKLSFQDIFFAMVNGRNGAGKSSLFMDALVDCLYEQPREGELTGWIRAGEKSGGITFTFQLGQDTYRVTRTRQRSGKATLSISKLEGLGKAASYNPEFPLNWDDISCQKLVDTQEKIIQLLGMDSDTFKSCVLIMQDQYGKFMEAKSEDRMSVLANLLGLGVYEKLEEETRKILQDVNRELRSAKDEISILEAEVAEIDSLESLKNCTEDKLQSSQAALTLLKKDHDETAAKVATQEQVKMELENLKTEVTKKTTELQDKNTKLDELGANISQTEDFLKTSDMLIQKHSEIQKTKQRIAAFEGTLNLLMDKKSNWKKVKFDVSTAEIDGDKLKSELSEINSRLGNYESYKTEWKQLKGSEDELTKEDENKKTYDLITSQINDAKNKLSSYENTIKFYESQSAILKDSKCIDINKDQCGFLKSAKEAIEKVAPYYDSVAKLKSQLQQLENKKVELSYDSEKHAKVKSAAERFRKINQQLAILEGEKKSADMYESQIAKITENINSLNLQMTALDSEIKKLEDETANVESLEKVAEELQPFEDQYEQLPQARAYLEVIRPQLDELQKEIPILQAEKIEVEGKIAKLEFEVNEGAKYAQSLNVIKFQIQELESTISTQNRELGSLDEKILVLMHKKDVLEDTKKEIAELAAKASRLQLLLEAFGQDGIPHQIIRDIIPELETSANEILGQMTGGRMRLEFRTERTLKSNKAKEIATLDIVIIDVDNGELPYLSRSGGQKTRCSLSVIFALAMLKASRVGLQLGMLFIDEPAGLDEEGIDGYCTALETIHSMYSDMRIIAISHDERMKARFAQQLIVDITEKGSKVRRA